jgi:ribosomal protein L37AE/L43A
MGLVIKVVVFAVVAVAGTVAARRLANAARAPISDDECVSCGSSNVEVAGAGAYVCLACGYEGGSGRAAMHQQAQADRYADLSPADRVEAVTDRVRTAARILSNYDGKVAMGMVAATALGLEDLSNDEGFDASAESIAHDLSAAAAELQLAATIAGGEVKLANGFTVDTEGVSKSLLEAQDGLIASVAMRTTAAKAYGYLQEVLAGTAQR